MKSRRGVTLLWRTFPALILIPSLHLYPNPLQLPRYPPTRRRVSLGWLSRVLPWTRAPAVVRRPCDGRCTQPAVSSTGAAARDRGTDAARRAHGEDGTRQTPGANDVFSYRTITGHLHGRATDDRLETPLRGPAPGPRDPDPPPGEHAGRAGPGRGRRAAAGP